jgi:AAA+ superfamily predicted ATPase
VTTKRSTKTIDPIVKAYLEQTKHISYEEWQESIIWDSFKTAITNKKSNIYKQIIEIAYEKLEKEAYKRVKAEHIHFE